MMMMMQGSRLLVKMDVHAEGPDPAKKRNYKITAEVDVDAGMTQNKVQVKMSRKENPALGMPHYMFCTSYTSAYPQLEELRDFIEIDWENDM